MVLCGLKLDDFESWFNVRPLHHMVFDPYMDRKIKDNNIFNDQYYLESKDSINADIILFSYFLRKLDKISNEEMERETSVIKWVSDKKGYGLFAKK